jgi:multidrug transporter EmrE-like cation transporter
LPRFVIGGVLMAATGVVLAISGVAMGVGFAILVGCAGLATMVSGSVVFFRFMRQPVEADE